MNVPEKPSLEGLEAKWGEWWEAAGTYRFDRTKAREDMFAIHGFDEDMILATRAGVPVLPRSFDRALALIIEKTGLPRLTSHGLRHTAATHMVRSAADVGELWAVADVLGHGPDVLMRIYAHTLPESMRAVTDKISRRAGDS